MRHNPSTVIALAGQASEEALASVGHSMNVVLIKPEADGDTLAAAASALRRAAGISAPYVLVAADPLAAVAAQWEAMWEIGGQPRGGGEFELRATDALASWRASGFELPDYYLVAAREPAPGSAAAELPPPSFHLGPLRALRPHRVAVVAASQAAAQAAEIRSTLASLRHGRWWPPLPEVIDSARRFYPGSLAPQPDGPPVPLLG